jgi:hypothetical protein
LEAAQKINPLLAFPYYFLGIRAQNIGDYGAARLYFENAARYHSFYLQQQDSLKPNIPSIREVFRRQGGHNAFTRELGIFSRSGVAVWIHLTEVYL